MYSPLNMMPTFCSIYLILSCVACSYALQCRDQNNQPVDWYVIYKLPKQKSNYNRFIEEGLAFMYMTSKNYDEWVLSDISINDTYSMVAQTLSGLNNGRIKKNNLYILYNDQPPYGTTSESKGHTKGVILSDENHGLWLIHSVPHFPYSLDTYEYPDTGLHYGQSFLCISLDLKDLDTVGIQLQYNQPHIYAQNIPQTLVSSVPEIFKAADNQTVESAPWYNIENITSLNGTKFLSFAKSGKFGKDLYSDLVGLQLQSDLYVETWPNEPNRLPSECDKTYQVDNVLSISVTKPAISFKTTVDHSKWAVSIAKIPSKWICIGDINRAEKQTERGGGTNCLNNEKLASNYLKIVSAVQQCENQYFYQVFESYFN